jgi:hypothetical protein
MLRGTCAKRWTTLELVVPVNTRKLPLFFFCLVPMQLFPSREILARPICLTPENIRRMNVILCTRSHNELKQWIIPILSALLYIPGLMRSLQLPQMWSTLMATAFSTLWHIQCVAVHDYGYSNHCCSMLYDLRSIVGSSHHEERPLARSVPDRNCGRPSPRYVIAPRFVLGGKDRTLKAHLIFEANKLQRGAKIFDLRPRCRNV